MERAARLRLPAIITIHPTTTIPPPGILNTGTAEPHWEQVKLFEC